MRVYCSRAVPPFRVSADVHEGAVCLPYGQVYHVDRDLKAHWIYRASTLVRAGKGEEEGDIIALRSFVRN